MIDLKQYIGRDDLIIVVNGEGECIILENKYTVTRSVEVICNRLATGESVASIQKSADRAIADYKRYVYRV